jgi:hypothetical protein
MKSKILGEGFMEIVTEQLTHLLVPRTCHGGVEVRLKAPFQNLENLFAGGEQLVKSGIKAFVPGRIYRTSYDSGEDSGEKNFDFRLKRSHLSQVGESSRDHSLPPIETLGLHRSQGPVDGL